MRKLNFVLRREKNPQFLQLLLDIIINLKSTTHILKIIMALSHLFPYIALRSRSSK